MIDWLVLAAALASHSPVVCIDPGHPSEVGRGAQGKHVTELHLNWVIAKDLEALLKADHVKVVMTKSSEKEFVTNLRRAEIANDARADLLIRLHCDGGPGNGFTVYWPQLSGKDKGVSGPSATVRNRSGLAARAFVKALSAQPMATHVHDNGLKDDRATLVGHQHGALIGSIHSKVPVLLIEMANLDHPSDEAYLNSRKGQEEMASALEAATLSSLKALRAAVKRPEPGGKVGKSRLSDDERCLADRTRRRIAKTTAA